MLYWVTGILIVLIILIFLPKFIKPASLWDRSPTCLVGKTTIVTGANSGIGFYTAEDFAKRGAKVILACRDKVRAEKARTKIIEATGNPNVHVRIVDFASLQSVREFAKQTIALEDRLDILVNNAGGLILEDLTTGDGLSASMQVNHLGPFLLTLLLIDLLKKSKPSRIINVSSMLAHSAKLDVNNLNYFSTSFISKICLFNYANSKLCNILFTNELARRLRGSGVTTNSLHPGSVYTGITRNFNFIIRTLQGYVWFLFMTPQEGAQTSIHLAVSKKIQFITGEYFDNCKIGWMPNSARDPALAKKVWEKSEDLVKLTEEERRL